MVTESTVTAMAETLGLDGNLWRKIKGAVVAIFKGVVQATEIVLQIAPILAEILVFHEQRWAGLHPSKIPKLALKYAKPGTFMKRPVDPIAKML